MDLSCLYPSEYEIMQCLWEYGDLPASQVAKRVRARRGWHVNTTYTIIGKCVKKGFIERTEPRFHCHAIATKDDLRAYALKTVTEILYDGDPARLVADLSRLFPQDP